MAERKSPRSRLERTRLLAQEHSSKLLARLQHLRKQTRMCDGVLCVDGRQFHIHRVVVCASSRYFEVLLSGGMAESYSSTVEIQGVDGDVFSLIIDFIYTGYIDVNEENVQQLLPAAKMLQLDDIERCCCDYLLRELDPSNCIGIFLFADTHSCTELSKAALDYVHRNFVSVSKQEEFFQLGKEPMLQLIESEHLKVDTESYVFEAAMDWVLYNLSKRRECLGRILERVRLPLISETYMENYIKTCQNESLKRMLEKILQSYRSYQIIARNTLKNALQPRQASRKCFYIVGGYSRSAGARWSDRSSLSICEKFDSFSQKCEVCSIIAPLEIPRCNLGVTALNGLVYAIGGEDDSLLLFDSTECYDPAMNTWSTVASMNAPRVGFGVCVVDNCIYVIGGLIGGWGGTEVAGNIEKYDPQENQWSVAGAMATKRFHLGVEELNGLIYAIGGISEHAEELKVAESYDPVRDKWTRMPNIKVARAHMGVASLGNALYVIGGSTANGHSVLDCVERYDPEHNEWTEVAPLPSPRAGLSAAVDVKAVYAVGGISAKKEYSAPSTLTAIDAYDPGTNKWSRLMNLNTSRCEFGIGVL